VSAVASEGSRFGCPQAGRVRQHSPGHMMFRFSAGAEQNSHPISRPIRPASLDVRRAS
jgi:hypothetical protein